MNMMRMTALSLAPGLVFALAACSGGEDEETLEAESKTALTKEQDPQDMTQIDCAIGEGSSFGRDCYVDKAVKDGKTIFIVRQPGGSFRRFVQLDDGRGLETADGADQAVLSRDGDMILVQVADDRYRFPAAQDPALAEAASAPPDKAGSAQPAADSATLAE